MKTLNSTVATVLAGVALTCLSGCGSKTSPGTSDTEPPEAVGYQIPNNIHYSDHWVQTPAVDLMSPEGTYIRAYVEGYDVAIFNIDKAAGSYPGYAKANHTNNIGLGSGAEAIGYNTRWILGFAVHQDNSVTAEVCYSGSVTASGEDSPGSSKLTLKFQRVGASPPANQRGTARAPLTSVFGDWYTTYYGLNSPDAKPDPTPCMESMPPIDKSPVSTPGWPGPESA